jgi:uncharacterized membrane protein
MSNLFTLPKDRIPPLVDGIFAVALTVLVLEIKVPELADPSSVAELLGTLQHHAFLIGAYFISFALLGLFWVWHHQLAEKVERVDGVLLCVVLAFLSLICFFPFAAAVFGRYIFFGNVGSLLFYLPLLGLILLLQTLYLYIADWRGLLRSDLPRQEIVAAHRYNLFSVAAFTFSCVPASILLGVYAAAACALAAIAFLVTAIRLKR